MEMDENEAATKIQAVYRGHRVRQQLLDGEGGEEREDDVDEPEPQTSPAARRALRPPHQATSGADAGTRSPKGSAEGRKGRKELTTTPDALHKRITLFRNGDGHYAGHVLVVDARQIRSFDALKDFLTDRLRCKFGAVRRLFAIPSGNEIFSMDDIIAGESYVASGADKLKRINYSSIVDVHTKARTYVAPDLSGFKRPMAEHARFQDLERPIAIHVFPNGEQQQPVKILLWRRDMPSMERVRDIVTSRLAERLLYGDVKKLYVFRGAEVTKVEDLVDGAYYVGVDRDPVRWPTYRIDAKTRKREELTLPAIAGLSPGDKRRRVGAHSQLKLPAIGAMQYEEGTLRQLMHEALIDDMIRDVTEAALHEVHTAALALFTSYQRTASTIAAPVIHDEYDDLIDVVLDYMLRPTTDVFAPDADVAERELAARFTSAVRAAIFGDLSHWEQHETSLVALVILLDQFPRTIWRGTPDMYQGDHAAQEVVLRAVHETHVIERVHPVHMLFPCLALSHQENMRMQDLCLQLWSRVSDQFSKDDPIWNFVASFYSNRETIQRFGRFPQRNALLGRESTPAEQTFLQSHARQSVTAASAAQAASAPPKRKFSLFKMASKQAVSA